MLAVVAWQRWSDIGLYDLPSARSLLLAWLPMIYIVGGFVLSIRFGLPPAAACCGCWWTLPVGLSEELMFRGVLLQALRHTVSIWPAVSLTTLAFGAVHSLNVSIITGDLRGAVIQSTAAALSGLSFIALRLRTGSLWPCIVIHGLWDCAAFLLAMSSPKDMDRQHSAGRRDEPGAHSAGAAECASWLVADAPCRQSERNDGEPMKRIATATFFCLSSAFALAGPPMADVIHRPVEGDRAGADRA